MSLSQECQGIFNQFISSTNKHQSIFIVSQGIFKLDYYETLLFIA